MQLWYVVEIYSTARFAGSFSGWFPIFESLSEADAKRRAESERDRGFRFRIVEAKRPLGYERKHYNHQMR